MERKKLLNLKEQLQKAVLAEEYERAAELRDIIRQLQNGEKEV
jgi:protein arginine kinase activator